MLQSFCFMHLQSLFVDHSEVVWLDHTSWGYDSRQLLLRRCSENWLYTSAGHASKDNSITLYLTFFSWSEMVQRSQPHSMKRAVMARCDCKANLPFCELGGFPATFYRLHTEKYNLILLRSYRQPSTLFGTTHFGWFLFPCDSLWRDRSRSVDL